MSDGLAFNIDALDSLTVEQIEWMEEALGMSLNAAIPNDENPDRPMGKVLRAFGYASMRSTNPDFTIEDAGKLVVNFAGDSAPPTRRSTPRTRKTV